MSWLFWDTSNLNILGKWEIFFIVVVIFSLRMNIVKDFDNYECCFVNLVVDFTNYSISSKSIWCSKTGCWDVGHVKRAVGESILFDKGSYFDSISLNTCLEYVIELSSSKFLLWQSICNFAYFLELARGFISIWTRTRCISWVSYLAVLNMGRQANSRQCAHEPEI